jgi:hypothetical protein
VNRNLTALYQLRGSIGVELCEMMVALGELEGSWKGRSWAISGHHPVIRL